MVSISATQLALELERWKDVARHEPVAVTGQSGASAYLISAQDFAEFQRLKAMARRAVALSELPPETIDAIATTRMDERHAPLDALLDR